MDLDLVDLTPGFDDPKRQVVSGRSDYPFLLPLRAGTPEPFIMEADGSGSSKAHPHARERGPCGLVAGPGEDRDYG